MAQIYPSLLACPESQIDKMVKQLEPLIPGFHIDMIDSSFAPAKGISLEKVKQLCQITYRQLWVHLMIEDPITELNKLPLPPDSMVTFHFESEEKVYKTIEFITGKKWLPSLAINPEMGINEVFPYLDSLYQVTIMSVKPGFSGQTILTDTLTKIEPLLGFKNSNGSKFKIALDGGINEKNIQSIAQTGVDHLVVGSAIFDAPNPIRACELLTKLAEF